MKGFYSIFAALCLTAAYTSASPQGRALPLFNIVRFKNEACNANSNRKGTCYTKDECENLGGKESGGECAEGFGVCCEFSDTKCGETSNQNSTYLLSGTQTTAGSSCSYTLCPINENICRIRYMFTSLVLANPVVGTAGAKSGTNGNNKGAAIGGCATDSLKISGGTGNGSPVICGTNTGQHMILDSDGSDSACHDINISLGSATGTTRSWEIMVTQYDCKDMTALENTAGPKGCLQYFLGDSSGTGILDNFGHAVSTTSSTYDGATTHLQNQDYNICIRRHAKSTRICYARIVDSAGTATAQGSFGLSINGGSDKAQAEIDDGCIADFITIPLAVAKSVTAGDITSSAFRICGRNLNNLETIAAVTVCSRVLPFMVGVQFNGFEVEATASQTMENDESVAAPSGYVGFHLQFKQD